MKKVLILILFVFSYINHYLQLDGNLPGILQVINDLTKPTLLCPQRCSLYWRKEEPFTKHLGNIHYLYSQKLLSGLCLCTSPSKAFTLLLYQSLLFDAEISRPY